MPQKRKFLSFGARHEAMRIGDSHPQLVAAHKAAIWAEVKRIGNLPNYRCVSRFLIHNVRETEWFEDLNPYAIREEFPRQGLVIASERYAGLD